MAEERNTAYLWTRMNSLDPKLEKSVITWRKLNGSSVFKKMPTQCSSVTNSLVQFSLSHMAGKKKKKLGQKPEPIKLTSYLHLFRRNISDPIMST